MNSFGQMGHSEGQCYKPGVLWEHMTSSAGGVGSGMASSKGGFGRPWGAPVTVITAPGRASKWPALDGFLNTVLQHPPHSGHHQLWWQHPLSSFSLHLLFPQSGSSAFSWLFEPWHYHLFRAAGALTFSSMLRCESEVALWACLQPEDPSPVALGTITPCHLDSEHKDPVNVPHLQFWAGKSLVT